MSDPDLPSVRLGGGVVLAPAILLAPMEGVTDPSFRGLVLDSNPTGSLGGVCTEFLRVAGTPLKERHIRVALGSSRHGVPVGLQLMGNDPAAMARSAEAAAAAGAAFVDLNFGCPAPRVLLHRAGSALLDDPPLLQCIVGEVATAAGIPVTAKIRAGGEDDRHLEEIARRIEDAGAAGLTVHARLRCESWRTPPDWRRIERVVHAVGIPVIGNGGAGTAAEVEAMLAETGCAGVMVGHGALADPWVFGAWLARRKGLEDPPRPSPAEVAAWLGEYARRMRDGGTSARAVLGRIKQILKPMAEVGHLPVPEGLQSALRATEVESSLSAVGLPSLAPDTADAGTAARAD